MQPDFPLVKNDLFSSVKTVFAFERSAMTEKCGDCASSVKTGVNFGHFLLK
jgi:hypothetical protein